MSKAPSNGLTGLRFALIFGVAALIGFTAPTPAVAYASCGNVSGCNSVPDGCGVGVNCVKKDCDSSLCPNPGGGSSCWYCQNEE